MSQASAPVSPSTLRSVMGRWATGVAVVTSRHRDADGGADVRSGCTVNAVTSVSLEPPLLLVCLAETARTLRTVRCSGRFGLSFLAGDQIELARVFASDIAENEKFSAAQTFLAEGVPVLRGCLAYAACRAVSIEAAGDHHIVVGEVRRAERLDARDALLFFEGALRGQAGPPFGDARQAA